MKCRWPSQADASEASSAEIIRLIVDDQRGSVSHWANEVYNRNLIREVKEFIGPTKAVVVTPAGMITTYMASVSPTLSSITSALGVAQRSISGLDLGPPAPDTLLGIDGCVCGETTPLQTVVYLIGENQASLLNTAVKVYGTSEEKEYLLGWLVCENTGHMLPELFQGHMAQTGMGPLLVLVCHEAVLFSGRSESNLRNELGLAMRGRFRQEATSDPKPRYIVVPTHWQDVKPQSGLAFLDAVSKLATESGTTVVMTMRTPKNSLEAAADRYAVQGPSAGAVVTLLVEDTFCQ